MTLIDSKSVTLGLGFQVLAGAETAEATGDVDQVQAAIERVRDRAHVYAALETMEFLRRSGRVGWAAAGIGALLQIKPMLEVYDGEVKSGSRVRTFGRAVEELIRLAHEQAPLERLAVLYISDRRRRGKTPRPPGRYRAAGHADRQRDANHRRRMSAQAGWASSP